MKRTVLLLITLALLITGGCTSPAAPGYTGPVYEGIIEKGWQETTIDEIEELIGFPLALPSWLPEGFEIREFYYERHQENSPPTTDIYVMISDRSVEWNGSRFRCRLLLYIGWNKATLGLKMPWAEFIQEAGGRLEVKGGEYRLWKSSYGDRTHMDSTVILSADDAFPCDEFIKIAGSIPAQMGE